MVEAGADRPPAGVVARVIARSFFLQASLNSGGMQNTGRLFVMVPIARWLGFAGEQWRQFTVRHVSLFNGNPFIAPLGFGALARIEADAAEQDTQPSGDMLERFCLRLSGPLGSVGDELFWTSVRPQAAILGVLVALIAGPLFGAAAFLACFSAWQIWSRYRGFQWGWDLGLRVGEAFRDGRFRRPARIAKISASFLSGAAVVAVAYVIPKSIAVSGELAAAGVTFCLALFGAIAWAMRYGAASIAVVFGVLAGIAVSAVAGVTE